MITKITIVRSPGREGLYLNGKLAVEGEKITMEQVLHLMRFQCDFVGCDHEWIANLGRFPVYLDDVKLQSE